MRVYEAIVKALEGVVSTPLSAAQARTPRR